MFIQIIQGKCTRPDECPRDGRAAGSATSHQARTGWLGGTYGFTDDDQFVAVVRFESRAIGGRRTPSAPSRAPGGPRWRRCSTAPSSSTTATTSR